jgi:hypothetical protein
MTNALAGRLKLRRGSVAQRRISRLTSALIEQWSDHAQAQEYLRYQWGERVLNAYVTARRAQRVFYFARWLVVAGATIVPTLVAAGARAHGTAANASLIAAVALSLLVAIAATAVQVQAGQRWRLFSQYQALLEHSGWQLYQRRGEYTDWDIEQRFAAFVDRVERLVLTYHAGPLAGPGSRPEESGMPEPLVPDWQWP